MDSVKGISHGPLQIEKAGKNMGQKEIGFLETLQSFYNHVDTGLKEADQKVAEFAMGKSHDLHEVMIASEKADLSLKFLLQIRNKLLEAYQEIMRMQF